LYPPAINTEPDASSTAECSARMPLIPGAAAHEELAGVKISGAATHVDCVDFPPVTSTLPFGMVVAV
jgi:hypothetical protein